MGRAAPGLAASAVVQRARERHDPQHRHGAEDRGGQDGERERERRDHTIELNLAKPWQRGRPERHEQAHAAPRQRQTDDGPGNREQQALGQEIARDAEAAGAKGPADGDLAAARFRSHQEEVGDVRARDEQHEADRREQDPERAFHPTDDGVFQRPRGRTQLQVLQEPGHRRVVRIGARQVGDEPRQLGPDGGGRHPVTRARHTGVHEDVPDRLALHLLGNPDIDARIGEGVGRRHDPDDLGRHATQRHRARDDGGIAAVAAHPQAVRHHPDLRRHRKSLCIDGRLHAFRVGEPPAVERPHAQDVRERCRHQGDPDALGLAAAGQRVLVGAVQRDPLERARSTQIVVVESRCHLDARRHVGARGRGAVVQIDQPIRVGVRQRVQDDVMHDGEDRRVGADRQGQRQHGGQRERRTSRQPPRREHELLPHAFDRRGHE
jgi:hypothetical protein